MLNHSPETMDEFQYEEDNNTEDEVESLRWMPHILNQPKDTCTSFNTATDSMGGGADLYWDKNYCFL